MTMASDFLEIS